MIIVPTTITRFFSKMMSKNKSHFFHKPKICFCRSLFIIKSDLLGFRCSRRFHFIVWHLLTIFCLSIFVWPKWKFHASLTSEHFPVCPVWWMKTKKNLFCFIVISNSNSRPDRRNKQEKMIFCNLFQALFGTFLFQCYPGWSMIV